MRRLILTRTFHLPYTLRGMATEGARTTVASDEQHQPIINSAAEPDQEVTPWSVEAKGPKGVDYDRVLNKFQSEVVSDDLKTRLEALIAKRSASSASTGGTETASAPLHQFLRRGIAFSHRGLGDVLTEVEQGRRFFLYTGRGPSATTMHVGHVVPFILTSYLQNALDAPLVVQITDDEKFLFRDVSLDKMEKMAVENIKDILAFGINKQRTFIFRNTQYMGRMYPTVLQIQRLLTANAVRHTLGLGESDNVGKYCFPATQAAPCFVSSFPNVLPMKSHKLRCLVPCAIDQDPFFVLTRQASDRLKRPKPSLLHTKFLPALKGVTHKMSSSAEDNGVITLLDNDATVKRKMKSAFSGGRATLAELQAHGADLDVDVAYQFLLFFEPSDEVLDNVGKDYTAGKMSSGAVKDLAVEVLLREVLNPWRERRAAITDDDIAAVMTERNILFPPSSEGNTK